MKSAVKNAENQKLKKNKKVLLRERKRHTARRVASARYAALSNWWGVGGTPSSSGWRGYPIQSRVGGVTPSSPDRGVGTPVQTLGAVLPPSAEWGSPCLDLEWGIPHPDLGWSTPLARPGMGYPPQLDGVPPPHLDLESPSAEWGTPSTWT